MSNLGMKWHLLPLFCFGLLALLLVRGLFLDPHYLPSVQVGKVLPEFKLPGLQNEEFSSAMLRNQVSLLNVWASWCSSCVEEQVFLLQLAQHGLPIYGLNYKDAAQDAKRWLKVWGNPFKMIGFDHAGKVALDLGVYGTPETFLIDKQGIIRFRYAGILNAKIWREEFKPRIKNLIQQ